MIFNQYSRVEGDRGAEEGGKWDLSEGGKGKQKSKRELFVVFSLIIIQSETSSRRSFLTPI